MAKQIENIILFDMDQTLCDHDKGLFESLEKLKSPNDPIFYPPILDKTPQYIKNRADLIRSSESWWENLEKLKLGWDILELAKELEFKIMILTQGPKKNPSSWSGKKKWIDKNLGQDTDITITRDKSLVYGKILVDDYPGYIEPWLEHRKRGLVIMPVNNRNKDYKNLQVVKYDGTNLNDVKYAMEMAKLRE
jgi:5'-nucleotidase